MCGFQEGKVITGKKILVLTVCLSLLAMGHFSASFLEIISRRALRKERWFRAVSVPETGTYQHTCMSDLLVQENNKFQRTLTENAAPPLLTTAEA